MAKLVQLVLLANLCMLLQFFRLGIVESTGRVIVLAKNGRMPTIGCIDFD